MRKKRYIVDTTLRDGEQSPGIALSMNDKVELAKRLDSLGTYEIEVSISASGEEEIQFVKEIKKACATSKISVWSRMSKEDIEKSIKCKPDIIHLGIPVSYVQIYHELKKNKTWLRKILLICADSVMEAGVGLTVGFVDASRSDIGFMISLAKELEAIGVKTIQIADTVGILTPDRSGNIVRQLKECSNLTIEFHAHNDLGMAIANSVAAAKAGAEVIDCTLGGIGARSGNCNFYDLLDVSESFIDFGILKENVKELQERLFEILSYSVPFHIN